jgi:hypothetical protein
MDARVKPGHDDLNYLSKKQRSFLELDGCIAQRLGFHARRGPMTADYRERR